MVSGCFKLYAQEFMLRIQTSDAFAACFVLKKFNNCALGKKFKLPYRLKRKMGTFKNGDLQMAVHVKEVKSNKV